MRMRVFVLALAVALAFFLASCTGKDDAGNKSGGKGEAAIVTVYITRTGAKYHRGGCQYLRQSKIATSLEDAKARGYTPCSRCRPPQ